MASNRFVVKTHVVFLIYPTQLIYENWISKGYIILIIQFNKTNECC